MPTQQILIRLSEEVATRLKALVPARKRNKFVADLVVTAIASYEKELGNIAAAVTEDEMKNPELRQETRAWESTLSDGLEEHAQNEKPKAR
jgi:predicted transcriptional regulator